MASSVTGCLEIFVCRRKSQDGGYRGRDGGAIELALLELDLVLPSVHVLRIQSADRGQGVNFSSLATPAHGLYAERLVRSIVCWP